MTEYTLEVGGMVCSNCEEIVGDAVLAVEGVRSVDVDASADAVTVDCDPDVRETVRREIDDLGFRVAE